MVITYPTLGADVKVAAMSGLETSAGVGVPSNININNRVNASR